MKSSLQTYLDLLFEPGESVCFGQDPRSTRAQPVHEHPGHAQYVTVNPVHDKRRDSNVTSFRSFLVEFDGLALDKQLETLQARNVPYTTLVFSGNKSYHAVISLEEPLESSEVYRHYARLIKKAVPEADPACGNPSRFTRLPMGVNTKTGKIQDLLEAHDRVPNERFTSWLATTDKADAYKEPSQAPLHQVTMYYQVQRSGHRMPLHPATEHFASTGGAAGRRHLLLFIAACNMRDCFYTLDEALGYLTPGLEAIYGDEGRAYELESKIKAVRDAFNYPARKPITY